MKARYLLLAIVLLGLGYTIGCGSGSNNNSAAVACPAGTVNSNNSCIPVTNGTLSAQSCQGSCQAGYVQTASGCLPQSSCPVCQGMSGTSCISTNVSIAGIPTTSGYGSCQGSCQAGYTQTQYGCLPQGSCAPCQGFYNNSQCVAGISTGTGFGGGYNPYGYNPYGGGYNPYGYSGYYPGYYPGYAPGYWSGGWRVWSWGY